MISPTRDNHVERFIIKFSQRWEGLRVLNHRGDLTFPILETFKTQIKGQTLLLLCSYNLAGKRFDLSIIGKRGRF